MLHSSARRGQIEPLAAIVAVCALGAGLAVYGGVLGDALAVDRGRDRAGPTLDRVASTSERAGVVRPGRLGAVAELGPANHELNVTLTTNDGRWAIGPRPPTTAGTATRRVSVRLSPGRIRPGRLTVRMWR